MTIQGLQKMTLLDFPGRVACTVFLGGCDLRCPFCHNSELLDGTAPTVMTEEDFLAFLGKRKGLLDGVAITGGEPLLRRDMGDFLRKIRDAGYPVKLDTNGTHPERLRALLDEGLLAYVAMDIKNSPQKYAMTCGLKEMDLGPIRQSAACLMEGKTDYEFRTTTVAELHNEESFEAIAQWIAGAKHYYLQKFTDRDSVAFAGFHAPSDGQMHRYAELVRPQIPSVTLRGVD